MRNFYRYGSFGNRADWSDEDLKALKESSHESDSISVTTALEQMARERAAEQAESGDYTILGAITDDARLVGVYGAPTPFIGRHPGYNNMAHSVLAIDSVEGLVVGGALARYHFGSTAPPHEFWSALVVGAVGSSVEERMVTPSLPPGSFQCVKAIGCTAESVIAVSEVATPTPADVKRTKAVAFNYKYWSREKAPDSTLELPVQDPSSESVRVVGMNDSLCLLQHITSERSAGVIVSLGDKPVASPNVVYRLQLELEDNFYTGPTGKTIITLPGRRGFVPSVIRGPYIIGSLSVRDGGGIVVVRLTQGGKLDRTYGDNGVAVFAFPGTDVLCALDMYRGDLLLGGVSFLSMEKSMGWVCLIDNKGRLDGNFGTNGLLSFTPEPNGFNAVRGMSIYHQAPFKSTVRIVGDFSSSYRVGGMFAARVQFDYDPLTLPQWKFDTAFGRNGVAKFTVPNVGRTIVTSVVSHSILAKGIV